MSWTGMVTSGVAAAVSTADRTSVSVLARLISPRPLE
jgi:hypothetical protein